MNHGFAYAISARVRVSGNNRRYFSENLPPVSDTLLLCDLRLCPLLEHSQRLWLHHQPP
jgi:hypothetical protein